MKTFKKLLVPCAYFSLFMTGAYFACLQLMGLRIVRDAELSDSALSTVIAIHFIAMTLSSLAIGRPSDKIGKKKVLLIGVFAFVAGCVMLSTSTSEVTLMMGIFLNGCGYGAMLVLPLAALADVFPVKSLKYANIAQTFFGIGSVISPVLCQFLLDADVSWRAMIMGVGILILLCGALTIFADMTKTARTDVKSTELLPISKIFKNRAFIMLCIGMLIYEGMEISTTFFADMYFAEAVQAPQLSAFALSGFWLAVTASRFVAGIFGINRHKILIVGFSGSVLCVLMLTLFANEYVSVANYIILGLLYGSMFPNLTTIAQDVLPNNTGMATSFIFVFAGIGGGVLPALLSGFMTAVPINVSMLLITVFSLLGVVISVLIRRRIKKDDIPMALR